MFHIISMIMLTGAMGSPIRRLLLSEKKSSKRKKSQMNRIVSCDIRGNIYQTLNIFLPPHTHTLQEYGLDFLRIPFLTRNFNLFVHSSSWSNDFI